MNELYPLIDNYNSGFLDVGSGHQIYYEESGNPNGIPVLYVNGGPGGFLKPKHRQYFDPQKYRIIAYNQRGCNNSKFTELLKDNTTQDLIEDIEKLRKHLNITKWILFGRSWGSTLVLGYAQKYSNNILAIITGGIFLARDADENFMYEFGANQIYPENYEKLIKQFNVKNYQELFPRIKEYIYQDNIDKAYESTMFMFNYEGSISLLIPEENEQGEEVDQDMKVKLINSGKIFLYYMENKFFLDEKNFLENISNVKDIPGVIIQGRYDLICPYINAWTLHGLWQTAEFITTLAGHNGSDEANVAEILKYTEKFANPT